ncbi:MAG: hypothetical protein JRJ47_12780 [Deltaproteobacteria bacterium]|nr:hypothetical protein [Deltaproteobacteria bacterium]
MEQIDWGYALSTLVIRFVGIFVVLGTLQIVMQISGRIFARLDARKESKESPASKGPTPEEIAAIALSLYLDEGAD